jgi:oligoribonuclease NrnB/cAMP/cGMP phosphodiesterase (DHH superfamily)
MTRPLAQSPVTAPDIVLYHAECLDGFGAAWAIWKKFPSATYTPVKHGLPPPSGLAGKKIVIVDFSYPRPVLEALAKDAASLLVLDHHVTAEKALAGLPYTYFDQKKSGAVLAWEWAHQQPAPKLLLHVQDKDLWHWALPGSREVNAALSSYPFDFRLWDSFRQEALEAEGRAILRYEHEMVGKLVKEQVLVTFQGKTVPAVQSAILNSQIGERLSGRHPFVVIWHDRDGRRYFSLRSREDGPDVEAIARQYGGGGHTHAAGFSVPLGRHGPGPLDPLAKPAATGHAARSKKRTTPRSKGHRARGKRRKT